MSSLQKEANQKKRIEAAAALANVLLKMAPPDGTRFIQGHVNNSPNNEVFWAKVQKEIKFLINRDLPGIADLQLRALSGLSSLFQDIIDKDLLPKELRAQLAELR